MAKLYKLKKIIGLLEKKITFGRPLICDDLRSVADDKNTVIQEIWKNKPDVNRQLPLTLDDTIDPFFYGCLNNPTFI